MIPQARRRIQPSSKPGSSKTPLLSHVPQPSLLPHRSGRAVTSSGTETDPPASSSDARLDERDGEERREARDGQPRRLTRNGSRRTASIHHSSPVQSSPVAIPARGRPTSSLVHHRRQPLPSHAHLISFDSRHMVGTYVDLPRRSGVPPSRPVLPLTSLPCHAAGAAVPPQRQVRIDILEPPSLACLAWPACLTCPTRPVRPPRPGQRSPRLTKREPGRREGGRKGGREALPVDLSHNFAAGAAAHPDLGPPLLCRRAWPGSGIFDCPHPPSFPHWPP